MHERPSPRTLFFTLPATLLIAALAAAGHAQTPEPAQSSPASEVDAASAESDEQGAAAPDGVAAGQPTGPLEDYEASEQISEDLSVSFPVDI